METRLCLLLSLAVGLMSGCPTRLGRGTRSGPDSRDPGEPSRTDMCGLRSGTRRRVSNLPRIARPGSGGDILAGSLDRCRQGEEVTSPILWAALDCPGGWCFDGAHVEFVPVLVSQSVDIVKPIHAGEEVIIVGWGWVAPTARSGPARRSWISRAGRWPSASKRASRPPPAGRSSETALGPGRLPRTSAGTVPSVRRTTQRFQIDGRRSWPFDQHGTGRAEGCLY